MRGLNYNIVKFLCYCIDLVNGIANMANVMVSKDALRSSCVHLD